MTTADANTRKAQERARKRAAGFVKVEVWVKPEHAQKVREYVRKLSR